MGAVDIGEAFAVDDSHLTDEFAAKCGLTLDGLKHLKQRPRSQVASRRVHVYVDNRP